MKSPNLHGEHLQALGGSGDSVVEERWSLPMIMVGFNQMEGVVVIQVPNINSFLSGPCYYACL